MELVLIHYHLNRGGVTRVIENHLRAIASLHGATPVSQVTILYGGEAQDWDESLATELPFGLRLHPISDLGYDRAAPPSPDRLAGQIRAALSQASCDPTTTVVHAHNHNLGKNTALPAALVQLACDGWRLLLQIHDFAEDLRPDNYLHLLANANNAAEIQGSLYPHADQIHYAVLNRRDRRILASAGISHNQLHYLPNPVRTSQPDVDRDAARRKLADRLNIGTNDSYVLYPVRAIRRKNLGEILMWATLIDSTLGITLAPMNPIEQARYQQWKSLAESLELSVRFDVGGGYDLSLADNYAAADAVITTSVAEGFGLVFLEATIAERQILGRDLPGITDDFRDAGMSFPGLADGVAIPIDCVDLLSLKRRYEQISQDLRRAFQMPAYEQNDLRSRIDNMFDVHTVDFARCDCASQQEVIRRCRSDIGLRQTIQQLNPVIQDNPSPRFHPSDNVMDANFKAIETHYSLSVIGDRLLSIYQDVLSATLTAPVQNSQSGKSILDYFVQPNQLYPLRIES